MTSITSEVWKAIPGYDDYDVSDFGRVRRMRTLRILVSSMESGYERVTLIIGGKNRKFGVHQLVALAFIGPRPDGCEVNHIDLDKANNAPGNLEYLTHVENLAHARSVKGWAARGETSGRSTLTEAEVREIRLSTLSQRACAAKYGISGATVSYIRNRKTWAHVKD